MLQRTVNPSARCRRFKLMLLFHQMSGSTQGVCWPGIALRSEPESTAEQTDTQKLFKRDFSTSGKEVRDWFYVLLLWLALRPINRCSCQYLLLIALYKFLCESIYWRRQSLYQQARSLSLIPGRTVRSVSVPSTLHRHTLQSSAQIYLNTVVCPDFSLWNYESWLK